MKNILIQIKRYLKRKKIRSLNTQAVNVEKLANMCDAASRRYADEALELRIAACALARELAKKL